MENLYRKDTLLLAGFRFPHHSISSGYHHLADFLPCSYMDAGQFSVRNSMVNKINRRIKLSAFELLLIQRVKGFRLVHYLYPEDHLMWSVPHNPNIRCVATVHLPSRWLWESEMEPKKRFANIRRKAFANLDGIIALSEEEARRLREIFPNTLIKFVPHGITRLREKPKTSVSDGCFTIVVVGSNYREKDTFFELAKYAAKERPHWKFVLIGTPKDWKDQSHELPNILMKSNLPAKDYLETFESAHVHFLPVSFATANNALLEAHALGVPTVASRIPGIVDYAIETTGLFSSVKQAFAKLDSIDAMSAEEYRTTRLLTHASAYKFYWESIAEEITTFYDDVFQH